MEKTILFGGLTPIHEKLIKGAVESLGYRAEFLPTPDNSSLSVGREYCNRGMCNPTYYTVGNLIKFLKEREKEGIPVEERFAFVTVGACGPCRFGMYEMEYRHALKEAGFRNFNVSILNQDTFSSEGIIELSPSLIWRLVKAIWIADILRDIGYQIRPYELNRGETDNRLSEAAETVYSALRENSSILKLLKVLKRIRNSFSSIEVDYSRVKPVVSVIGEFWAHTTEGDGNYNIHRWLEEEGAEVKPEPIAGWIDYQLFMEREKILLQMRSKGISKKLVKRLISVSAMANTFRAVYNLFRHALSGKPRPLPSQRLLRDISKGYFDHFVVGGEGHLEVAKHIYNVRFHKSHMVLSVKPFGCMPSTQSDGAQARVLSDYPESIFISVETSGDGEVNVKSRIQMKLFEAKKAAQAEFEEASKRVGVGLEELSKLIMANRELRNPFSRMSKEGISTTTKFLMANSERILTTRRQIEDGLPVY